MHCVDSLMSAVQYSEYVDMKKLINTTLVANMKKETVTGLGAKELTKKIRILADKMTFPSTVYNTAGVRQWSNKQDLVLFIYVFCLDLCFLFSFPIISKRGT